MTEVAIPPRSAMRERTSRAIISSVTFLRALGAAGAMLILLPNVLLADEAYLFVRIDCHPDSKSTAIYIFTKYNDEGLSLLMSHAKDVYSVIDDKILVCDLGDNELVRVGPSYTVPDGNTNNITVETINMGVLDFPTTYYLDNSDWTIDFKAMDSKVFAARYCANADTNFGLDVKKRFASQFKNHEYVCETVKAGRPAYNDQGTLDQTFK